MAGYDAIILGTGGVGSAAAYHLARRGAKVLGIDRFPAGHDRGSSHGETRIIRQAYFEHPDYVPLLLRAYELWRELERTAGEQLLHQVGLLQIGPPDGTVVRGVIESAQRHHLNVEQLSDRDILYRFRGFAVPEGSVGVFEVAAGYLKVERCVIAHVAAAQQEGAEFLFGQGVRSFRTKAGEVAVDLDSGETLHASRLILTAGPWAQAFLSDLGIRLTVRRKHAYWFPPPWRADFHTDEGCPTFLYELPDGLFYGFPVINKLGMKVAEHTGGEEVNDPLTDSRDRDPTDLVRVRRFLQAYLPDVDSPLINRHSVCYYTMSPDEHFLVDRHPQHERVFFAAGLSGHGFKFTSVLGEALADLALEGQTRLPIEFLRVNRFRR